MNTLAITVACPAGARPSPSWLIDTNNGPGSSQSSCRWEGHSGGSRLRPLICIGAAYFLIAVLVPLALLVPLGDQGNWSISGAAWSLGAGSLGAVGALGTILAFTYGGKPFTVMPVVFGCAPVINTLATIAFAHTPLTAVSPWFLAGLLIVAVGAATVLVFGPRGHAPAAAR